MFGWFAKNEHPLLNGKKARALIAQLPAEDPFRALEEISEWLESLLREKDLRLDDRINAYKLLDEAAYPHLNRLRHDFLAVVSQNQYQENRLWSAIYRFRKHIAQAYISGIEGFRAGEKGINAVMADLPLLCCRALRALEMQFKWAQLHHGSLDVAVWKTLYRTYQFAELHGVTRKEIALYPGSPYKSSVEQQFLTVLMLWSSAPDNLLPLQFEIAERITVHLSRHFVLKSAKDAKDITLSHYADLAGGQGPMRITTPPTADKLQSVRFFSPGKAYSEISNLIAEVSMGSIPAALPLGGNYPADIVLHVLRHLERHWSSKPPSRESERMRKTMKLKVIKNFSPAMFALAAQDAEGVESWESNNVSRGGYDAILPRQNPDWVQIGILFILQPENSNDWELVIARRLSRNPEKNWHVGLQILGKKLEPVLLRDVETPAMQAGILVNFDDKEALLLVKEEGFSPRSTFEMNWQGNMAQLVPIELLERGSDFILWRFRVPKKSA